MISIKNNVKFRQEFSGVFLFVIPQHLCCRSQAIFLLCVAFLLITFDELGAADRIWLEPAPRTVAEGDWFPRNIAVVS